MTTTPPQPENADHSTGLPLLSTWPRVYTLVLAFFLLTVFLLYWLTRTFS